MAADGLPPTPLFEVVEEGQHLAGDPDKAGSRLSHRAVLLGEPGEERELLSLQGEVALFLPGAVGEDDAGVEFAAGAATVRPPALPAHLADQSAPERRTILSELDERGDPGGEFLEPFAGLAVVHLYIYIVTNIQTIQRTRKNKFGTGKQEGG